MHNLNVALLELTKKCNLKCKHCGTAFTSSGNFKELSLSQWKKVLRDIKELGGEKVIFTGGEPTIKKDFVSIIKEIMRLGLKYAFISNGLFIGREVFQEIVKNKPYTVRVSIDGDKDLHNYIRGCESSFQQCLESVGHLQAHNIPVCIVTTVSKLNWTALPEIANLLKVSGVEGWQIQLAWPYGKALDNQICFDEKDDINMFDSVCSQIVEFRSRSNGLRVDAADCFGYAPKGLLRDSDYTGCSAGISSVSIDAFGNVLPCLSMQYGVPIENISSRSLTKIWEYSSIFDFNRYFKLSDTGEKCKNCDEINICQGGCTSQSYAYSNKPHNMPFCFYRTINNTEV